jgi:hypothetical protein
MDRPVHRQAFIRNAHDQIVVDRVFRRIPRVRANTIRADYTEHIAFLDTPTTAGEALRMRHRYSNN